MPKPTWKGHGILESVGVTFAGMGRPPQRQQVPNSSPELEQKIQPEAPVADAVIVDAIRTARGKRKESLASVHPVDPGITTIIDGKVD